MDDITDANAQPTSNIMSYISEDGSFMDGWRDTLPEDIRNEKVFDRAVNINGVFKSLASAEKKFGMKSIPLPDANADESAWGEFFQKVHEAKPDLKPAEKPEDYKYMKDKEVPDEYWPKEIVGIFQKASLDAKVTTKQAEVFNKAFNEFLKGQIANAQIERQGRLDELKKEWTGSWDANIHIGNLALEKATEGDPELKQRIAEGIGTDPDFARVMKNLGVNFKEGKIPDGDGGAPLTSSQVEEQMNTLRNSEEYKTRTHPGHNAALKRMSDLYEMKKKIA